MNSSEINEGQNNLILELLPFIVKKLSKSDEISDDHLEMLLSTKDLDEVWAVKRVKKIIAFLVKVKNLESEDDLEILNYSLQSLGIPSANIHLSFDELKKSKNVIEEKKNSLKTKLSCEHEILDFGNISSQERKSLILKVKGTPCKIINNINCIKISKTELSEFDTDLEVVIDGSKLTGLLFESIYLENDLGSLEIRVSAKLNEVQKPEEIKIESKIIEKEIEEIRTEIYPDGSQYTGEFKNGMKHGKGTFTWTSGSKYVGEFKNNLFDGNGTKTWVNVSEYIGKFKNDKFNGQGTYTNINGSKYVGEWKDNKRNGYGIENFASGKKYVGQWKNDRMHGQGTCNLENGNHQTGIWENDVFIKSTDITVSNSTVSNILKYFGL